MAVAVILFLTGAETKMIQQTVGSAASGNSNSLGMLWGLAQCGMLLALCSAVVKKIPYIAQEIAGGVYHGTASAHSATFGLAGWGVRAAAGSAGAARVRSDRRVRPRLQAAGGQAVAARPFRPAGHSQGERECCVRESNGSCLPSAWAAGGLRQRQRQAVADGQEERSDLGAGARSS